MDATALLLRQGWRGTGHSLDTTNRGIKKPLLISHKRDTLGLGKKKAAHNVDDQWWMRAFDESLRSIGSGAESTLAQVRKQGINRGGLYGFFVRGEGLRGTIGVSESTAAADRSGSGKENERESTATSTSDTSSESTSKTEKRKEKKKKKEKQKSPETADRNLDLSPEAYQAITAKLSKLTSEEKAQYEERARAKKQTLEQYVLRRIQKKDEKKRESSAEVKIQKRKKGRELLVESKRVSVVEVTA
ncbi:uncharacterized protein EI97DRAFT_487833 [Westerdykella ornata]|uniref:G-patch domain-containing protein n=1 Tax=Westerdykella ornata TaxID=318751 RepID=A0A6A6JNL4_WESOR|nr:uncharacterized protein EI97DRAFT_487833 [Westerdykella ornata]KAF2277825.1 hypothetical protein EI97DRAFT_487833 [Westerdykella ornata]